MSTGALNSFDDEESAGFGFSDLTSPLSRAPTGQNMRRPTYDGEPGMQQFLIQLDLAQVRASCCFVYRGNLNTLNP
jgi:hypothetical protein